MASVRYGLGVTSREAERVCAAFRHLQFLPVIPYLFPWYELLLEGKLNIQTDRGEFAVKTGLWSRKHTGWTLFYHSKSRVANMVAARHHLNPRNHELGVVVGAAYLDHSQEMTPGERFALALRFNNYDEEKYLKYWKARKFDTRKWDAQFKLEMQPSDWVAMPYPIGNFYRPSTLTRFKSPLHIKYPSGAVTGTTIPVTPEIIRSFREVGVTI